LVLFAGSVSGFLSPVAPFTPQRSRELHFAAAARTMSRTDVHVVTFDIDGTICVSSEDKTEKGVVANAMHRSAFAHAFKSVCGFEASIDEVLHHGMIFAPRSVMPLHHGMALHHGRCKT